MNIKDVIEGLKYKDEIRKIILDGGEEPEEINSANDLNSYRFAFNSNNRNNHIPVYKQTPPRLIQDKAMNKLTCSGYALSCFSSQIHAEALFKKHKNTNKNFHKIVGESLSNGIISNADGLVTVQNSKTHFDLYEYISCNLRVTFNIVKSLI